VGLGGRSGAVSKSYDTHHQVRIHPDIEPDIIRHRSYFPCQISRNEFVNYLIKKGIETLDLERKNGKGKKG
jgi:hypothetical protein